MQYSHATVDLILMAVNQKDIEHWKEPAVQMSWGILPYHLPIDTIETISKLNVPIKHMNSMHNIQQFLYLYDPILQPMWFVRTAVQYMKNTCLYTYEYYKLVRNNHTAITIKIIDPLRVAKLVGCPSYKDLENYWVT